ncbi:MAG: lactate utilization protein [Treponemataceae bacterium]
MNEQVKWLYRRTVEDMTATMTRIGYICHPADDAAEAARIVYSLIPEGSTVGLGGSTTLSDMGVPDTLRAGPWKLIDRYRTDSWDETMARYREALDADVFLTGTNAITRAGQLVDMDSSGNRVAATIFGPRRVIVVAGANKVVENLDAAFARIRRIAPMNCRRLGHKTPCAESGRCEDCMIPERMCNYVGIVNHGMKESGRFHIVLVAEELGF